MALLLGIDVGTSGAKTMLLDSDRGAVVASALGEYPLHTPQPGWTEQDPADWWAAVSSTIRQVLQQAGVAATAVTGVGLSGQMHGSVFLDAAGEVIRPALLWNDQRTGPQCDAINAAAGELLVSEIRNPVLTGFQAGKILWLRDVEPAHFARLRQVLLPKDYLRYKLTGEFATEVSDASGTALLNVPQRTWSTALLDRLELPAEWFPRVVESPEVTGTVTAAAAAATGLAVGTPVVGGAGDCAAGAVGTGIVEPGLLWVSTGTSGVVFASADTPATDADLRTHTFCHAVPGKWHIMGVMLSAGGSLRWYRDVLAGDETAVARLTGQDPYELITAAAATAPAGCEGLVFLPYLTGERTPHPDPNARGAFLNLSLRHDQRHLARAVLEGVAFGLRDAVEIMKASGVPIREVRASGGGARSALWRQIQADVFGLPISTINIDEGAALGVALLAGVGTGVWPSVDAACAAIIRPISTTAPQTAATRVYEDVYQDLYRPLYGRLREQFAQAAGLVARHMG
ncbi:MAG: xylulokinase [Fimbriimonadaceae bacterium]|nr:xylulokinase [Fimbriimonadaceae bacterium]